MYMYLHSLPMQHGSPNRHSLEVVTYVLSEKKRTARVSCGKNPGEPLYGGTEDGEERGEADERSLRSCARLGVRLGLATVTVKLGIRHRNTVAEPCRGARQTFACGTDTTQERAVWTVR
jgi:hypothetical protein